MRHYDLYLALTQAIDECLLPRKRNALLASRDLWDEYGYKPAPVWLNAVKGSAECSNFEAQEGYELALSLYQKLAEEGERTP